MWNYLHPRGNCVDLKSTRILDRNRLVLTLTFKVLTPNLKPGYISTPPRHVRKSPPKKTHVHSTYLLNCETDYKYIKCVLLLYTRISHSHLAMSSRAPFASTWIVDEENPPPSTPSTAPLQCANLSFHTTNACVAYHFVSALYCRGSSLVRAMNKRVPWWCDIYTTETQTYAGTSVSWVSSIRRKMFYCLSDRK